MQFESLEEEIEALVVFRRGFFHLLRFTWSGRDYQVGEVTSRWVKPVGTFRQYYFALQAENGNFYVVYFDTSSLSWTLSGVYIDG